MKLKKDKTEMTKRKKITYKHNETAEQSKTTTTTYYESVEEFTEAMNRRKEKLYPHLQIEIVSVEDIEVDPYASAFKEDSRYRYNG